MRHTRFKLRSPKRTRRGSTILLAVVALFVVMACMALVLDRLWLEAASVELTTASEAAALAAGRELASDELLKEKPDGEAWLARARRKAAEIAAQNLVAGEPLMLDIDPESGDVRIGRNVLNDETGELVFIETANNPTAVFAHGERSRSRWNPVALFLRGVSGQPVADVVEEAQAGIDNHVVGLRPFEGVPVPALPLAILKTDPRGIRTDTWDLQIENRRGTDHYRFDAERGAVVEGPDGIPEIALRTMKTGGTSSEANLQLVDLGTDLNSTTLISQIETGWTVASLDAYSGRLMFSPQPPTLDCDAMIPETVANSLRKWIGQPRILLIYTDYTAGQQPGYGTLRAVRPVAGRICSVAENGDGSVQIVVQPTVMTARTAILASEARNEDAPDGPTLSITTDAGPAASSDTNRYLYKLQLTH